MQRNLAAIWIALSIHMTIMDIHIIFSINYFVRTCMNVGHFSLFLKKQATYKLLQV